jgi:hypothetical protein
VSAADAERIVRENDEPEISIPNQKSFISQGEKPENDPMKQYDS